MSDDLRDICFKDIQWMQVYPLNEQTALDYFATSPFYDRTCNNEVLKMQTKFNSLLETVEKLTYMKGLEYALLKAEPPRLFVICKRRRSSSTSVQSISLYYILEGTIYPSPSLFTTIASRCINALYGLKQAFDGVSEDVQFHPSKGHSWQTVVNVAAPRVKEYSESEQRLTNVIQTIDQPIDRRKSLSLGPPIPTARRTASQKRKRRKDSLLSEIFQEEADK